jgi:DNA-binding response OmpR family regulator
MPGPKEPVRILVGDDESQICGLVRDVLRPGGYAVDFIHNGRELLEICGRGGYSLLILDAVLQQTSAMEIVTKIRDRGDRVPIILMSGPPHKDDRLEPFAFTYRVDVLRKPFGVRDLRVAVDRALGTVRPD